VPVTSHACVAFDKNNSTRLMSTHCSVCPSSIELGVESITARLAKEDVNSVKKRAENVAAQ
jgi:hypothetical protein